MPKKQVKLRWTDLQREVADKVAEGAVFDELVVAGYSKSLISKVLKAIRQGQSSTGLEPRTEKREPRNESSREAIGGIDETRQLSKPNPSRIAEIEKETSDKEEGNEDNIKEPKLKEESVGDLGDKKDGGGKGKYEVTIAGQGIRCVVYLSLQTLALYEIAAARQTQLSKEGEAKLFLGDYLDNCSEQFFKDRKLKLGLVEI